MGQGEVFGIFWYGVSFLLFRRYGDVLARRSGGELSEGSVREECVYLIFTCFEKWGVWF